MGLWIITRLKLRTDQMTTHGPSSRSQSVQIGLEYTKETKLERADF